MYTYSRVTSICIDLSKIKLFVFVFVFVCAQRPVQSVSKTI